MIKKKVVMVLLEVEEGAEAVDEVEAGDEAEDEEVLVPMLTLTLMPRPPFDARSVLWSK